MRRKRGGKQVKKTDLNTVQHQDSENEGDQVEPKRKVQDGKKPPQKCQRSRLTPCENEGQSELNSPRAKKRSLRGSKEQNVSQKAVKTATPEKNMDDQNSNATLVHEGQDEAVLSDHQTEPMDCSAKNLIRSIKRKKRLQAESPEQSTSRGNDLMEPISDGIDINANQSDDYSEVDQTPSTSESESEESTGGMGYQLPDSDVSTDLEDSYRPRRGKVNQVPAYSSSESESQTDSGTSDSEKDEIQQLRKDPKVKRLFKLIKKDDKRKKRDMMRWEQRKRKERKSNSKRKTKSKGKTVTTVPAPQRNLNVKRKIIKSPSDTTIYWPALQKGVRDKNKQIATQLLRPTLVGLNINTSPANPAQGLNMYQSTGIDQISNFVERM